MTVILTRYMCCTEEGFNITWKQIIYNNGNIAGTGYFLSNDANAKIGSVAREHSHGDGMKRRIYTRRKEYLERKGT